MTRPQKTAWSIDVTQLRRTPGEHQHIHETFPAPSGIGDNVIGVGEGEPVLVDGYFDAIIDGLILTANVRAPVHACCVRCLTPIERSWDADITAFFPYETGTQADTPPRDHQQIIEVEILAGQDEAEDTYPLSEDGSFADLERLMRDTLVGLLPVKPLCRPDCKGLCPECGINLNEHPEHHHEVSDSRFAQLTQLKAELERQEQAKR